MPGNGTQNLSKNRFISDAADATTSFLPEAKTKTRRRIALKNLKLGSTLFFTLDDSLLLGRECSSIVEIPYIDLEPYNAFQLGVSRRHALLKLEEEQVFVIDTNSSNGVWLNQDLLRPNIKYAVLHGDTIRLGELTLQIGFPVDSFFVLSRRDRSRVIV
jgi:pSer/pThr/pTyr-binding forkhead associated (FHA) protein